MELDPLVLAPTENLVDSLKPPVLLLHSCFGASVLGELLIGTPYFNLKGFLQVKKRSSSVRTESNMEAAIIGQPQGIHRNTKNTQYHTVRSNNVKVNCIKSRTQPYNQ